MNNKSAVLLNFSALFILVVLMAGFAGAHLVGGIDVPAGKYVLDVGFGEENLTAETPEVFLVNLGSMNESLPEIETKNVWILIENDQHQAVFSAKLLPEPTGAYSFVTMFPSEGKYKLTVKFSTNDDEIVETSTQLNVVSARAVSFLDFISFAAGLLIALIILVVVKSVKKIKQKQDSFGEQQK